MSGGTTIGASGYGLLGILVGDSQQARRRVETLTQQAADGKVADGYAGLGTAAALSVRLEPALATNQARQRDIAAASGRMQAAQTALEQISAIASDFRAATNTLSGLNASAIDSVAAKARDALKSVAGLLDARDGDTYVFGGQASDEPPVPNPDGILSSGFFTAVSGAVAGLAANGAGAVTAATMATAQSNTAGVSPFSATLSQPPAALAALRPAVQVGDGQRVPTGLLASANADVASTGAATTGSYTRDILRAIATLGSLSGAQAGTAGFSDVVADVRSSLTGAVTALNQDAGVMGDRAAGLATTKATLAGAATVLESRIGDVENVDMTRTLAELSAAQSRLQASYQLIAGMQSLSLVKFLGGG